MYIYIRIYIYTCQYTCTCNYIHTYTGFHTGFFLRGGKLGLGHHCQYLVVDFAELLKITIELAVPFSTLISKWNEQS